MASKDDDLTVLGAYVTVKTNTSEGPRLVGLYEGSPWPKDASPEATKHHLDNGLIGKVGQAAPEALATPVPAAQVPDEPVGEPGGPKPARVTSPHEGGGKRA